MAFNLNNRHFLTLRDFSSKEIAFLLKLAADLKAAKYAGTEVPTLTGKEIALIEEVNYGYAYSFKYSTRPGTPAAERAQVPEEEKDDRLQRLQALITRQQRTCQDGMVGREVGVLFEKPGRFAGQMVGKSDYLHAVHVTAPDVAVGEIHRVRIVDSGANSLAGEVIAPA